MNRHPHGVVPFVVDVQTTVRGGEISSVHEVTEVLSGAHMMTEGQEQEMKTGAAGSIVLMALIEGRGDQAFVKGLNP